MALNEKRVWLIAYDIADPKRLKRIHRYLKRDAMPVQYSLFVARASAARIGAVWAGLAGLIDEKRDDVRIYLVPSTPSVAVLGRRALPEGVDLLGGDTAAVRPLFTASPTVARVREDGVERVGKNG